MLELIKSFIKKDENIFLEYKSKWYWENSDKELSKAWGEFLKDFVALYNANHDYINEDKYLIIGINESKRNGERIVDITHDINGDIITKMQNLDIFKSEIISKIKNNFKIIDNTEIENINFELSYITITSKKILVFNIKPTYNILVLKKDLQDKKATIRKNSVLIRTYKDGFDPEVSIADPLSIEKLKHSAKTFQIEKETERKKEISIEKTVNLFTQHNDTFNLETPHKVRQWKENISCDIFPLKSILGNIEFIYIHEKTSQKKTYDFLIKNKLLDDNSKKIILISENSKKENLKKIFNTNEIYYIEEFGSNYLYNEYFDENIFHEGQFNVKDFIEPFGINSKEKTAYQTLFEWYNTISNPLMVVKGHGGIGKTTLVKYLINNITGSDTTNILFINSKEILNDIVKFNDINDVFHFYEALVKKRQSEQEIKKIFDKELLQLSVDNGNLLIILDGIDEVIAKAGSKFNVNKFIDAIYTNYAVGSEKTKIIITCRDFFWDNNMKDEYKINTIILKPFDILLTEKFFNSKFFENKKSYEKAILLAQDIALSSEDDNSQEKVYIPYILDLIADIILKDKEFGHGNNNDDFESDILDKSITNDYLIGRICDREIIKLENITIDGQIDLFICLAIEYNGKIALGSMSKLTNCSKSFNQYLFDKFKGHPLLTTTNEVLYFKYDFFTEYFKNLYVSEFFNNQKNNITNNLIEVLADYIRYDNSFTNYVCKRISINDELKLFCIDLIEDICANHEKIDDLNKRKFKSSIIILLLVTLRLSGKQDGIESRTNLLKEIFGEHTIENLSIINLITGDSKYHPTFNFSNITFKNCWFENYDYFWECKTNKNTRFENSTFKHLEPRKGIEPKIFENLFSKSCDITDIEKIIINHNDKKSKKSTKIENRLKSIFRYFELGSQFKDKKISDIRSKYDTSMLDTLIENNIIQEYVNNKKLSMGKQYRINSDYDAIIDVLEQGGSNIEFKRVLNLFK